jgi:hypothetical protein
MDSTISGGTARNGIREGMAGASGIRAAKIKAQARPFAAASQPFKSCSAPPRVPRISGERRGGAAWVSDVDMEKVKAGTHNGRKFAIL